MERKEAIRGAYRMTGGNSFYDGMITCSTLSGESGVPLGVGNEHGGKRRLSGKGNVRYSGAFLRQAAEVPVGKGILTMPVYQTMPEADITLSRLFARYDESRHGKKADRLHLKNVTFRQGDVGALS